MNCASIFRAVKMRRLVTATKACPRAWHVAVRHAHWLTKAELARSAQKRVAEINGAKSVRFEEWGDLGLNFKLPHVHTAGARAPCV